jgi:sulfotransferase
MKDIHFISSLPRSGSTLLATTLNQNPEFRASIAGPLARYIRAAIEHQHDSSKNKQLIESIVNTHNHEDKTYFVNNRGLTLLTPVIKQIYPNSKIIVCVRDINWILDSFEQLIQKNMLEQTSIFSGQENLNVFTRCEALTRSDRVLGFAYDSLKQAYYGNEKSMLHFIEYNDLCKHPEKTMKKLYEAIGKPYFNHDFNNVFAKYEEFDDEVRLKDLHTTKQKLDLYPRKMIIPPQIQDQYRNSEFWRA